MNKWTNEQMNEWTNERMNEWLSLGYMYIRPQLQFSKQQCREAKLFVTDWPDLTREGSECSTRVHAHKSLTEVSALRPKTESLYT
jgi:hypothetical protein